jgi:hypothetical protein
MDRNTIIAAVTNWTGQVLHEFVIYHPTDLRKIYSVFMDEAIIWGITSAGRSYFLDEKVHHRKTNSTLLHPDESMERYTGASYGAVGKRGVTDAAPGI